MTTEWTEIDKRKLITNEPKNDKNKDTYKRCVISRNEISICY